MTYHIVQVYVYHYIFSIYHEISSWWDHDVSSLGYLLFEATSQRNPPCVVPRFRHRKRQWPHVCGDLQSSWGIFGYFRWWLKSGDHQLRLVGEIPVFAGFIHPWWLFGISSINSCRCNGCWIKQVLDLFVEGKEVLQEFEKIHHY